MEIVEIVEIANMVWLIFLRLQPFYTSRNTGDGGNHMGDMPEMTALQLSGNSENRGNGGYGIGDMLEVAALRNRWK